MKPSSLTCPLQVLVVHASAEVVGLHSAVEPGPVVPNEVAEIGRVVVKDAVKECQWVQHCRRKRW